MNTAELDRRIDGKLKEIDSDRDKVDTARGRVQGNEERTDIVVADLGEMRKSIEHARRIRKDLEDGFRHGGPDEGEYWDGDKAERRREVLADLLEDRVAVENRLVDRLDVLSHRSETAEEALKRWTAEVDKDGKRLERLRKKRATIEAKEGQASENFYYVEFNCHEGDPVPEYMYPHIDDLCERVLEKLRSQYGAAHVNSGHRWKFYNIKIGGALSSYHEYELRKVDPAADCTFAQGSASSWAASSRALGAGGVGQYSSFVHNDTGPVRTWAG